MSKVEQGTGKAVAAKKNKVDADLLDPGSETPIERMDIVLPGAEEIGAPATHANEQPLDASVKTSSPAQTNDGNQNPENTESSSFGDTDPSAVNAPTSNSVGQTGSIRIDNAPPLDGADAASNDDGVDAPLAPESNLADAQSNTSANNQQQISSSSPTSPTGTGEGEEINVAPVDIAISNDEIAENASGGTVIATLSTVDGNVNDQHTYAIINDPSGFFEIVGDEIRVKEGADLDFEVSPVHELTIEVTDSAGNTFSEVMTINLTDVNEHDVSSISDTNGATNEISEDASDGDSVGLVASAFDADGTNNSVTYSLSDDAGGIFTIDEDTGEVTIANASGIDYENATSHTIEVTATSADGSTSTQNFTIDITDIDEHDVGAISDTDGSANTIAENVSNGDSVGITASATDADGSNNTVTYSLSDDAGGIFTIDANTGEVSIADASGIDYETATSHTIEVTATSEDGSTSTQSYAINVSDVDEFDVSAVSDNDGASNAVDEDASVGDTVGITALATDGDATNSDVTYSLSDDAGGLFDIDPNTGVVTVAGSLDAETDTSHTIEVTATSDDGSTSTQTFSIGVNDVNETSITAISDTDGSGNSVTEGASVGTAVGITAFASDADATDTVSYSLSSNPGDFFAIDANTGEVTVASALDYETDTSHTIEVTATSSDGTTSTQTFTIAVDDEDEHDVGAISDTDGSANTIAENVSNGDSVGITASATDADGSNNTVTYALSDDASGIFTIDANTGEVSIADASSIDYETATSHTIEVTATSEDGSTSTQSYTINVSDVDEFDVTAITDTDATANSVDENASVGDTVGITALATDGDATDSVTYSLSDDAGGLFDIDPNTGVVTVAGSLDAETDTSHTIEVTATSDDGSTSTQTFSIGVNDVNETSITAISDTDGSGNSVTEGASVGTAVGITAFASDADETDTISYSLSSNPGGFFAMRRLMMDQHQRKHSQLV
ncbi:MAG: cadherin repeat domain-containing protein [Rhizobiaceae bacterium]|nr:cadherin repeat domain-containing protein [Rhizobiaceae bacterium]